MKKTVKLFGFITFITITIFSLINCGGNTKKYNPETDFNFSLIKDGKEIMITKYIGETSTVNIPPKIKNLPVTTIGRRAFEGADVNNITIPKTVTFLGKYAFDDNPLLSVTIGSNVDFEEGENSQVFDNSGLEKLYIENGKLAGTYSRPDFNNNNWKEK